MARSIQSISGVEVFTRFGREAVLRKLAYFYKGMAKRFPQLTHVAEDFFAQHPDLR